MIEFQHERDRRRFMKHNMELAKKAELELEQQRVDQGKITEIRRPLIDKIYRLPFKLRD